MKVGCGQRNYAIYIDAGDVENASPDHDCEPILERAVGKPARTDGMSL